jgi:7,8-dihydropterin-6-yl-methyl-4-(beta-D-ribofuranosyl)aminobenzene 5'-phosphate synthase
MYTTTVFSVRVCHRFIVWMALTILVGSFTPTISMAQQSPAAQPLQNLTITVIYDNNPYKEGLKTSHGFSCLIQGLEKTILFDTGGGSILLTNMETLGIHPQDIDVVVLSHIHSDHVGGLPIFLRVNHNVTVYLLNSFLEFSKNEVKKSGAGVVEIQEPLKICEQVYSSGELGEPIREQALFIQTDKGVIVITGCAHPGIVPIVQKAKELLNDEVLLVMGGFHLSDESKSRIENIVSDFRKLGVQYVGPCHCSGDSARNAFQKEYQNNFIPVGVGRVITLEELP